MTRLLLARHGETTYNRQGIVQGQTDTNLSEAGENQAEALADRLADESIEAIYSSDLQRAKHTARIIGYPHDLTPISLPQLAEQHVGEWQGREKTTLFEMLDERGLSWVEWTPTDGEAWPEFSKRVLSAIKTLCERHPEDTILVVGHAEVNKVVLAETMYSDVNERHRIDQANVCLNELQCERNRSWCVNSVNDVTHHR